MSLSIKINALIKTFRHSIPAEAATAHAIDSNAPRKIIVACARREGYTQFGDDLESLMQGRIPPRLKAGAEPDPPAVSSDPTSLKGVPVHNH